MKKWLLVLGMFLPVGLSQAGDKMIDTIKRIDPGKFNNLLIPGFFITPEEKERYIAVSQKMTNSTFEELHSISLGDVFRFAKGSTKLCLSGLSAGALYALYKGMLDLSLWDGYADNESGTRNCKDNELTGTYRKGAYSVLAALSTLLFCSGVKDFTKIIQKEHRLNRHRDALAVEAVIQRLPVCNSNECESSVIR